MDERVCSSSDILWREDCNREASSSTSPTQMETRLHGIKVEASGLAEFDHRFTFKFQLFFILAVFELQLSSSANITKP